MAARLTDGCMMNDPYRLNSGPAKTAGLFFSLLSVLPARLRQPRAAGAPIVDSPSTRLQPSGLLPDPSRIRRLPHQIRTNTLPAHPGASLFEAADGTIIDSRRSEPSVAAFRDEG